jgi:hypothetical protein
MTAVNAAFLRLHCSGWSIGEIAGWTPDGPYWLVWGTNGENVLRAEGRTKEEAWRNAEMQAMGMGILRR